MEAQPQLFKQEADMKITIDIPDEYFFRCGKQWSKEEIRKAKHDLDCMVGYLSKEEAIQAYRAFEIKYGNPTQTGTCHFEIDNTV